MYNPQVKSCQHSAGLNQTRMGTNRINRNGIWQT